MAFMESSRARKQKRGCVEPQVKTGPPALFTLASRSYSTTGCFLSPKKGHNPVGVATSNDLQASIEHHAAAEALPSFCESRLSSICEQSECLVEQGLAKESRVVVDLDDLVTAPEPEEGEPEGEEQSTEIEGLEGLLELVKRLTRPVESGGCPWTAQTLPKEMLRFCRSEIQEIEAELAKRRDGEPNNLQSEIGDLLFNTLLLLGQLEARGDGVSLEGASNSMIKKLRKRTPYIFPGGPKVRNIHEAEELWFAAKRKDKKAKLEKARREAGPVAQNLGKALFTGVVAVMGLSLVSSLFQDCPVPKLPAPKMPSTGNLPGIPGISGRPWREVVGKALLVGSFASLGASFVLGAGDEDDAD